MKKKQCSIKKNKQNHDQNEIAVSIVVPVYNTEKYLSQCLDSIVNQTFQNIEILLIDDGSSDSSLLICQEYAARDPRIHLFAHKNKGVALARNFGISQAKGKYILFLDSDDYFEPTMIQLLYQRSEAAQTDITFCDFSRFNSDTNEKILKKVFDNKTNKTISIEGVDKTKIPNPRIFSATDIPEDIWKIIPNTIWCQLYRLDFLLNENLAFQNIPYSNDVFFSSAALILAKRISFVDQCLVHYRKHSCSLSQNREADFKSSVKAALKLEEFLKQRNIYNLYRKSFLQHAFGVLSDNQKLCEPVLSFWKSYFRTDVMPHLFEKENFYLLEEWQKKMAISMLRKDKVSENLEKFYKLNSKKVVPVVFATNNSWSNYMAVAIQSIIDHSSSNRFYDIYILFSDLNDNNKRNLERLSQNNVRVTCMDVKDRLPNVKNYPTLPHITKETYYRFLLPEIFYGYDKAIYLDCDIICQKDLADLFDVELGSHLLAGCYDPVDVKWSQYMADTLHVEALNYVNAGMLVFNLKQWREENISSQCWENFHQNASKLQWKDQDILNMVCNNRILKLDVQWNCLLFKLDKLEYQKEFKSSFDGINIENMNILHYASSHKPWGNPENVYADIWWSYARKSPFYENILFKHIQNKISSALKNYDPNSIQAVKTSPTIQSNNVVPHNIISQSDIKKQVMKRGDEFSSLMIDYIKESLLYIFTFGSSAKKHKKNIQEITALTIERLNKQ